MKAAVAGAGPAGLSASLALVRLGFEVEVYEKNKEWSPRVCGAFLSPEAHSPLQWLGISPDIEAAASPCRGVSIHAEGRSASFPIDKAGVPGLAIGRRDLESHLLKKAQAEGVRFRFGEKIVSRPPCDLFVAAGGRFSNLQEDPPASKEGWLAFNVEMLGARQKPGELSLHFFPKAYVGTLSFADGSTNVSGLIHSDFRRGHSGSWEEVLDRLAERDPALGEILRGAARNSIFKGIPYLPFGFRMKAMTDFIAVGDNAAVCDPYMGEGIARALGSGPLLYRCLKESLGRTDWRKEAIGKYRRAWKKIYRPRQALGAFLRGLLKDRRGLIALHGAVSRFPSIRSWVLRRAHRETAWTEGR